MSARSHSLPAPSTGSGHGLALLVRWAWVSIPLAWGVWQTVQTSLALFR